MNSHFLLLNTIINKKQINAIKSVLEGMYAKAVNTWTSISIKAEQLGPKYNYLHLSIAITITITIDFDNYPHYFDD